MHQWQPGAYSSQPWCLVSHSRLKSGPVSPGNDEHLGLVTTLDLSQQETGFTARISLVGDGGWQHQARLLPSLSSGFFFNGHHHRHDSRTLMVPYLHQHSAGLVSAINTSCKKPSSMTLWFCCEQRKPISWRLFTVQQNEHYVQPNGSIF